MKYILRRFLKNEFVLLVLFLIKQWFTLRHLNNRYNIYSKQNYILSNDTEFLRKYESYYESSKLAYKHMKNWLGVNRSGQILFNEKNVTLCVGILSQRRYTPINLNTPFESVIALLVRTRLKYQNQIRIDVFNVEESGQSRPDLQDLQDLINIIDIRRNVTFKISEAYSTKMKESIDYIYAMVYYLNSVQHCKYVLLLEDDSIPCPEWFDRTMDAIKSLDSFNNWFCLKLFTSFRTYDWLTHIPTVFTSIFMSLFISLIFFYVFHLVLYLKYRLIFRINRPHISVSRYIMLIFTINSILIIFLYRANHISPIGYGVHSFSIGFNTVANIYPFDKLHLISSYLKSNLENFLSGRELIFRPKDLALSSFRSQTGFYEYIVEPAIFQHVGLQSTLGGPVKLEGISDLQYRPFQSYSYEKEYSKIPIQFDQLYWTS